jgi:hypothetical protein
MPDLIRYLILISTLFLKLFCFVGPSHAWEVKLFDGDPYIFCKPVKLTHTNPYNTDYCDSMAHRSHIPFPSFMVTNVKDDSKAIALENPCFAQVWNLLNPEEGHTILSVHVRMAFFEDMAIANRLLELAKEGIQVTVDMDATGGTNEQCKDRVHSILHNAHESKTDYPNFTLIQHKVSNGYGRYHPKYMNVRYKDEESGQEYEYVINGSYNFTPAAWLKNEEVMAVFCRDSSGTEMCETSQWQVESHYKKCAPTNEGYKPNVDYDDTETFGAEPNGNDCYNEILGLLDQENMESVTVNTGYFEDKFMARKLRGLKDGGVRVTVEADNSKLQKGSTKASKKTSIKSVMDTLHPIAKWHGTLPTGGTYHPKFLKVVFVKDEADGKRYRYTYVILGSYNLTVAAWRSNSEAISIMWKKEEIEKQKIQKRKAVVLAEEDSALEPMLEKMANLGISKEQTKTEEAQPTVTGEKALKEETHSHAKMLGDYAYNWGAYLWEKAGDIGLNCGVYLRNHWPNALANGVAIYMLISKSS